MIRGVPIGKTGPITQQSFFRDLGERAGAAGVVAMVAAALVLVEDSLANQWVELGYWRLVALDAGPTALGIVPAFLAVAVGLGVVAATRGVPRAKAVLALACGTGLIAVGLVWMWVYASNHALVSGSGRTPSRVIAGAACLALLASTAVAGRYRRWIGPVGRAAVGVTWLGMGLGSWGFPAATGPDVLFVVVDTLRADRVGAWGAQNPTTPHLDAFAAGATRFSRAYAQAPWTTPSLAAILTSRQPGELGFASQAVPRKLPRSALLISEILSEHGWVTSAFISHTYLGRGLGFDQGYSLFDEAEAQGHAWVSSPGIVERVLRHWRSRGPAPAFTLVHFFDPHFAYFEHEPWLFDPSYSGPVDSGEGYEALNARAGQFSAADVTHLRATYDSEIRFTDEYLGRLFDAVRASGRWDQTLIVVVADHGEELCDRVPAWIGHGNSLRAEQTHVPLAIKFPGQQVGSVVDLPVGSVSLTPTVLAALGIAPPAGHRFDGPPLQEERVTPVFSETRAYDVFQQAVALGRLRLILDRQSGETRLYDVEDDPGEHADLASERPGDVDRLRSLLDHFNEAVRAREQVGSGVAAEFDSDEREMLEALGYAQ